MNTQNDRRASAYEALIESKHHRRLCNEDRALNRLERREAVAEKMIGELVINGRSISYIWPVGGKYREGTRAELIAFLIRNNYA